MPRPRKYPYTGCTCERCGKVYIPGPGDRGRFCSNECRRNQVEKVCPQCQKPFSVRASKADRYTYCSIECRRAANSVVLQCEHCGTNFTVNAARKNKAHFCSNECRDTHNRVTFTCSRCGKVRTVPRYRFEQQGLRHCSNRCATLERADAGWLPGAIAQKRRSGYRTNIEALTEAVLIDMGIRYEFERKIGRYSIDFCLPDLGIALECDGWQHNIAEVRKRDVVRDANLQNKGWLVVRVKGEDIRRSPVDAIRSALASFISLP